MSFRARPSLWRYLGDLTLVVGVAFAILPATAQAHGPINPAASSFMARVTDAPPGTQAKVVDGDLRLWLRVDPSVTLTVLDYRGAPYLRFSRSGVQVNRNSAMYYLNAVPAESPPAGLGPHTAPSWHQVSSGHSYEWHDGRLGALGTTVIAPGRRYLGRWSVAVQADGRAAAIAGGLYYKPDPPLVWFWPIVVVLACVFAGLRLRRPELDWRVSRTLAVIALFAFAIAVVGEQLHGRPTVTIVQVIVLVAELALAGWLLLRIVLRRHGWLALFVIAAGAIYQGATLITVLIRGFVLLALPALLARIAVATCLASGAGLVPLVFRIAPEGDDADEAIDDEFDLEDEGLLA